VGDLDRGFALFDLYNDLLIHNAFMKSKFHQYGKITKGG
jgi:hypothetical protein